MTFKSPLSWCSTIILILEIKKIPCSSEHGYMESWQSGLSRLFAKQVNQKVTGVRIPCFPQSCINERTTFGNLRSLWERPIYERK